MVVRLSNKMSCLNDLGRLKWTQLKVIVVPLFQAPYFFEKVPFSRYENVISSDATLINYKTSNIKVDTKM